MCQREKWTGIFSSNLRRGEDRVVVRFFIQNSQHDREVQVKNGVVKAWLFPSKIQLGRKKIGPLQGQWSTLFEIGLSVYRFVFHDQLHRMLVMYAFNNFNTARVDISKIVSTTLKWNPISKNDFLFPGFRIQRLTTFPLPDASSRIDLLYVIGNRYSKCVVMHD